MASLLFFLIGANQEEPRYFPPDKTDKMIEWQQLNPGRDLYHLRSAAAQLRISESFFRSSVKNDPTAPVIIGRGMIACNTPALQHGAMVRAIIDKGMVGAFMQWEYKLVALGLIVDATVPHQRKKHEQILNDLGREEWEAVAYAA